MKINRQKEVKKALRFYKVAFNLTEPYKVLVDFKYIKTALKHKIYLKEQIPSTLGGKCKLMITPCMLMEIKNMGESSRGEFLIAKHYERYPCSHEQSLLDAQSCILDLVGTANSRKICVATDDEILKKTLNKISGVPIICLKNGIISIKTPSFNSKLQHENNEKSKLIPMNWERKVLGLNSDNQNDTKNLRRKKKRNPNPLSCMKKKSKTNLKNISNKENKKKTRSKRLKLQSSSKNFQP